MRTSTYCLAALLAASGDAAAREYPVRPVRVILGYAPATTPDVVSRTLFEPLAGELRHTIVVDNRPGAGGTIASELASRATPDGHTLLVDGCSAAGIVYGYVMTGRPPLDPFKDFTPVARLMRDHWLVTVSPAAGARSLAELIALAKAKPGLLTFPSSGVGSSQHLQSERFRMRAGIEATHVPYKHSPIPDLIAARVTFAVQTSPAVAPFIKAGKLRGLAVLSHARVASLPDVPTTAEAGLPDLVYNAGVCLYAPGGTPRDAVELLNQALNKAQSSEAVRRRFDELGVETVQGSVADTARFVAELMALVDELRVAVFGKAR